MQSRGFLPAPRQTTTANNNLLPSIRINGDLNKVVHETRDSTRIYEQDRYYKGITPVRNDRIRRTSAVEARRAKRRNYRREYEDRADDNGWKEDPRRNINGAKPILRNGVGYERPERVPYCSTIPRRSRTINFKDQAYNSLEELRGYPKSLQDLTDFEVEERIGNSSVCSFPKTRTRRTTWREEDIGPPVDVYRQRRLPEPDEKVDPFLEDDYLKFCRNLARMERYPRGGHYKPGQVHYERECRTFGKDTLAFIYYKTCYL